jgi:hypothetical protein
MAMARGLRILAGKATFISSTGLIGRAHWWHGTYSGRPGWWWIVGPDWYWFPTAIYLYPDPYTLPGMGPGYWYWCDDHQQYYPYVEAFPSGWRTMPLQ